MAKVDPAIAQAHATEMLTFEMRRLNEYLANRQRPTTMGMLMGEQMSSSMAGSPMWLPAGANVSTPPEVKIGGNEPGEDSKYASDNRARAQNSRIAKGEESQSGEELGQTGGYPVGVKLIRPGEPNRSSPIRGMNELEAATMEAQAIKIPQFGDWQLDNYLKLAAQISGKFALSKAKSQGLPEGLPEGQEPPPSALGNLSGVFAWASQGAAPLNIAHRWIKAGITQPAYAAAEQGASLGYNPESGVGGAYILGIRNPLAALTSEAGKQGLGAKANVISNVLSGGTSFAAASNLSEALSEEGVSNQKEGFMGLTTGGEREQVEQAIFQAVPGAKTGALHGKVAAGFFNAIRYGTGSVRELQEAMEGMEGVAKTLKQGLNQTAEAMQAYGEESYEHGATKLRGLENYKSVAQITGQAPSLWNQVLESPLGQAQTIGQGLLPGQISTLSGPGKVAIGLKTLTMAEQMVPAGMFSAKQIKNAKGEVVSEESAEEARLGFMQEAFGIPAEQFKIMKEHRKSTEAAETVASHIGKAQQGLKDKEAGAAEHWKNSAEGRATLRLAKEREETREQVRQQQRHIAQLKREGIAESDTEKRNLASSENTLKEQEGAVEHKVKTRAPLEGGRTGASGQVREEEKTWGTLKHEAEKIEGIEFGKIKELESNKKPWSQKLAGLQEVVGEAQKKLTEEQSGEGKILIELSKHAREWLKIKNEGKETNSSRAGGPSTASEANNNYIPPTIRKALEHVNVQEQQEQKQGQ